MSASDLPPYIPGSRVKAVIAPGVAGGYVVHAWAADTITGDPSHADGLEKLGVDALAVVDSGTPDGPLAILSITEPLTRFEAEELLRTALPGIEIEPEGWNFG